jgi:hypothetical protein
VVVSIPQPTELLFQVDLVWVWVSVEADEVDVWLRMIAVGVVAFICESQARTIGVLVGIEQDVVAVILVVTIRRLANDSDTFHAFTHSRAHRYGFNFNMFGLAHVSRLKGDFRDMAAYFVTCCQND